MKTAQLKTLVRSCIITIGFCTTSAVASAATLTNFSVSPTPYTDGGFSNTTTSPNLYLGSTSSFNSCTGDMCDSCTGLGNTSAITAATVCSERELKSGTNITFTFTNPTAATVGNTVYAKVMGSSNNLIGTPTAVPVTAVNQTMSVTIQASTLVTSGLGAASFQTSAAGTITVGWGTDETTSFTDSTVVNVKYRYVDTSMGAFATWPCTGAGAYEGVCNFDVFPGDQKAYITPINMVTSGNYEVPNMNVGGSLSTADTSTMIYSAVRMYYIHTTSTTAATFTPASAQVSGENDYQDIQLTNGSLQSKYVSGLNDYTQGDPDEYQFVAASIDQAGILTYFTNPASENFAITPTGSTQACQPQKVYGLINGQGCMIATAAYGSVLEPQVTYFREFRGRYLMNNALGRQFVHWYYQTSPPWAVRISQSENLRGLARAGLFPLLGFVRLSLWIGFWPACGVLMLLLAGIIVLGRRLRIRSVSGARS